MEEGSAGFVEPPMDDTTAADEQAAASLDVPPTDVDNTDAPSNMNGMSIAQSLLSLLVICFGLQG